MRQIKPTVCAGKDKKLEVTVKLLMIGCNEILDKWVNEVYTFDNMRISDVENYLRKGTTPYKIRKTKAIINNGREDPLETKLVIKPFGEGFTFYELRLILKEIQINKQS